MPRLEFERKSGILTILKDADVARLFVADGRIVKVEASESGAGAESARERLLRILDGNDGNFEFVSCEVVE